MSLRFSGNACCDCYLLRDTDKIKSQFAKFQQNSGTEPTWTTVEDGFMLNSAEEWEEEHPIFTGPVSLELLNASCVPHLGENLRFTCYPEFLYPSNLTDEEDRTLLIYNINLDGHTLKISYKLTKTPSLYITGEYNSAIVVSVEYDGNKITQDFDDSSCTNIDADTVTFNGSKFLCGFYLIYIDGFYNLYLDSDSETSYITRFKFTVNKKSKKRFKIKIDFNPFTKFQIDAPFFMSIPTKWWDRDYDEECNDALDGGECSEPRGEKYRFLGYLNPLSTKNGFCTYPIRYCNHLYEQAFPKYLQCKVTANGFTNYTFNDKDAEYPSPYYKLYQLEHLNTTYNNAYGYQCYIKFQGRIPWLELSTKTFSYNKKPSYGRYYNIAIQEAGIPISNEESDTRVEEELQTDWEIYRTEGFYDMEFTASVQPNLELDESGHITSYVSSSKEINNLKGVISTTLGDFPILWNESSFDYQPRAIASTNNILVDKDKRTYVSKVVENTYTPTLENTRFGSPTFKLETVDPAFNIVDEQPGFIILPKVNKIKLKVELGCFLGEGDVDSVSYYATKGNYFTEYTSYSYEKDINPSYIDASWTTIDTINTEMVPTDTLLGTYPTPDECNADLVLTSCLGSYYRSPMFTIGGLDMIANASISSHYTYSNGWNYPTTIDFDTCYESENGYSKARISSDLLTVQPGDYGEIHVVNCSSPEFCTDSSKARIVQIASASVKSKKNRLNSVLLGDNVEWSIASGVGKYYYGIIQYTFDGCFDTRKANVYLNTIPEEMKENMTSENYMFTLPIKLGLKVSFTLE